MQNVSKCFESLPVIPGGWTKKRLEISGRTFRLMVPAAPDDFLNDRNVLAANARDDYMPYWTYLWPAARSMAEAVLRTGWEPGVETLEIGAGIGLVGLAGLAAGLHVTFSDYQSEAVQLALFNAELNGFLQAKGMVLDWREPISQRYPLILGCDVLYERKNHAPVWNVVKQMLRNDGLCWIGDPGRQQAEEFCRESGDNGFALSKREFDFFKKKNRFQRFQLLELQRRECCFD